MSRQIARSRPNISSPTIEGTSAKYVFGIAVPHSSASLKPVSVTERETNSSNGVSRAGGGPAGPGGEYASGFAACGEAGGGRRLT